MRLILFVFLAGLLLSCGTSSGTQAGNNSSADAEKSLSLTDHLRKVPGVMVNGDGRNAKVTIRGSASFYANTDPLFVVNGQPVDGGFGAVVDLVPPASIKSIRVLKTPDEVGIYGVRGANGVIEIRMQ